MQFLVFETCAVRNARLEPTAPQNATPGYTAGSLFATSQGYNDLFLLKLVDNGVSRTVAWSLQPLDRITS